MKNLKSLIEKIQVTLILFFSESFVKELVNNFKEINKGLFVGIREYQSKTSGEIANYVVNVNFSYTDAVNKDIKKLQSITQKDIIEIATQFNLDTELINKAVDKLLTSFLNNQNKETQSNQSKAQQDTYIKVTNSIKMHKETKQFYIYALSVNKSVIEPGEYKQVNSRPLTIAQNAVKKYLDFHTKKFRNFIIDPDNLSAVASNGNTIELI